MIKLKKILKESFTWDNRKFGERLPTMEDYKEVHDKKKINELKAAEYQKLRKNFEKTYKAYWDAVYDYEQGLKKQGLKKEAMTVHRKYMKNVLGFHSWMRQWIRKVY